MIFPVVFFLLPLGYLLALACAFGFDFAAQSWMKRYPVAHCAKCGYDMQGLEHSTPCPECGRAPSSSLSAEIERARRRYRASTRVYTLPVLVALILIPTAILLLILRDFSALFPIDTIPLWKILAHHGDMAYFIFGVVTIHLVFCTHFGFNMLMVYQRRSTKAVETVTSVVFTLIACWFFLFWFGSGVEYIANV